jgi:DeoR family myo-inositol catabolism operon transcriptional repressor
VKLRRRQQIEEYVKTHGSASLDELCQHFDVSKNTIRRDMNELETRGLVKKVYGGVVWNHNETTLIPSIAQREVTMQEAKSKIARKAAEWVHDHDIIILDSGTTVVQMVEHLITRQNLTIITNSVPVLDATSAYEQFHVIVTGGDLYHPTASFVGMEAISWLKRLNARTVFLAATGISLIKGITNYSTIEAEMKKAMMEISERIILLVDHTKFDVVSLMTFADLKDIDVVITDTPPPENYRVYCAEHAVEIVVANQ